MKIVEAAGGMYKAVEAGPGAAHDRRLGARLPEAGRRRASRPSSASTPTRSRKTAARRPVNCPPDRATHAGPPRPASRPSRPQRSPARCAGRARLRWPRAARSTRATTSSRSVVEAAEAGVHARRDLRHAAARDGLRPRAGDRVKREPGFRRRRPAAGRRPSWPATGGAVARAITPLENGEREPRRRRARRWPRTWAAPTCWASPGSPGAGKSTLVHALLGELLRARPALAVVAVDPSSPITGGAVLGDRVRMGEHGAHAGVFIRSLASRGHLGGLAADHRGDGRYPRRRGLRHRDRRDRRRRASPKWKSCAWPTRGWWPARRAWATTCRPSRPASWKSRTCWP